MHINFTSKAIQDNDNQDHKQIQYIADECISLFVHLFIVWHMVYIYDALRCFYNNPKSKKIIKKETPFIISVFTLNFLNKIWWRLVLVIDFNDVLFYDHLLMQCTLIRLNGFYAKLVLCFGNYVKQWIYLLFFLLLMKLIAYLFNNKIFSTNDKTLAGIIRLKNINIINKLMLT